MPRPWFATPALRHVADLVRLVSLASIAAAYVWVNVEGGLRFLVVTVLLVAVRLFHLVPLFDVLLCLAAVVSTWAGILNWYVTIAWMDEVIHFFAVGVFAAVTYLALSRTGILPGPMDLAEHNHRASATLVVTLLGFALASLWEFYEWVGQQVSPETLHVGYDDTISDLFLGGVGAALAGLLMAYNAGRISDAQQAAEAKD